MSGKRDLARELFIRRWIWEVFAETCKAPDKCGSRMLPSSCEGCRWNSNKAIQEAQEAADRLEAKEHEQH